MAQATFRVTRCGDCVTVAALSGTCKGFDWEGPCLLSVYNHVCNHVCNSIHGCTPAACLLSPGFDQARSRRSQAMLEMASQEDCRLGVKVGSNQVLRRTRVTVSNSGNGSGSDHEHMMQTFQNSLSLAFSLSPLCYMCALRRLAVLLLPSNSTSHLLYHTLNCPNA